MNNVFIREYSCWSRHRNATAVGEFVVFTSIVVVVGILTVCFTSPKPTGMLFCFLDLQIIKEQYNNLGSLSFERIQKFETVLELVKYSLRHFNIAFCQYLKKITDSTKTLKLDF
jgi:hypothetical protein